MSTDQPPQGQPPEDDPFLKKPQEPTPPSGGSPYGSPPPGSGGYPPPPPPGGPGGGGGYPPPPPPYGSGGDPYGGGGGMPDPLAGMPPLADIGKRLAARVIDVVIVAIPLFLIQLAFGTNRYTVETERGEDISEVITKSYSGSGLIMTLISILAYVGYDWFFTKKNGQTIGKKTVGLRVAMLNDGSVPQSGPALSRAAVLWLPTLICCFCLWPIALIISVLVDKPYKQGLHDKVAKTVVVRSA
ncbi:RDD family protein [Streptomyces antarcticus]|uniref:RDD family protein n=1 Tax=Streptomyces antarcticus TaxID=2996458 RepID=UPI002270CFB3|nr:MULTISPECIES: RDD family protein [unclassified Streptomyces]MCY0944580.1 RDD family protein [Streptomyces sp. H34-AA3]MCY0949055.1 RDD family protein [Streptomyces sp. H27-S2]MCZ4088097.1 RDD family protein [Streptomyces sp. H34-S5]